MSKPSLLLVPFREIRHDRPDDCLHYEPVSTRLADMNWTIPAHCHQGLHQFQFLTQGSVTGSIDGQPFEATAPLLLMMAPGCMHGFTYSADAIGHQITVSTTTLHGLLRGCEMTGPWLANTFMLQDFNAAVLSKITDIFAEVSREFEAQRPARVHTLMAWLTLLVVQIGRYRGQQFEREQRSGPRDALLKRYTALVEKHYRSQWTLAAYAEALGVTPDHLSRACRALTGQGALQLLHGRVLLEATRLLAYTPLPVTEIAEQLGFTDLAYFSKFFRRGLGHAPTEYRLLVAEGVQAAS